METREIQAQQWGAFIDQFSRDHAGWAVTIEVVDPNAGPHKIADHQPLQGISFDTRGTRPSSLAISAGKGETLITHVVDLPFRISLGGDQDSGYDIALQIEPAQGPATVAHFVSPFRVSAT